MAQRAVDARDVSALGILAHMKEAAGDREGAETSALCAADAGDARALIEIALARSQDGCPNRASVLRYGLDPDGKPSLPW